MKRVLITGGNGGLGRDLRTLLLKAGYTVRITSRQARPNDGGLEWAQVDLDTGDGLAAALCDVDIVVHAASNPASPQKTDVEGTRKLLAACQSAQIEHFVYISIVGVDQIPFAYYQAKYAAEKLIEQAGIPWTILRATQFHELLDMFIGMLMKLPLVAFVPLDFQFQLMANAEAAARLAELVRSGPGGRVADIGGPQVLTVRELLLLWQAAHNKRRLVINLPIPGRVGRAFRQGLNTTPANRYGQQTWAEWLDEKYGLPEEGKAALVS